MGMSIERWADGRDCRQFELGVALGLRLIKTAALARRASRDHLSRLLVREAEAELQNLGAAMEALDSKDRLAFETPIKELRDRIDEFHRFATLELHLPERARSAVSAEGIIREI